MTGRIVLLACTFLAAGCSPAPPPAPAASASVAPAAAPVATTTATAAEASRGPAPPTINGMYIQKGGCPGEGCYFGRMQATKALDIYDAPGKSPAVVGRLAEGEWVDTVTTEDRYAPQKGVVSSTAKKFTPAGVVYRLGNEGEGCFGIWDKGPAKDSWCDDGSGESEIVWDQTPPPTDGSEGLWVEVKRASGPAGWLRNPRDLRCMGYQDRDADCPPIK